jgi:L-2-hydroxyglutarate oxidase LhgO
VLGGEQYNFSDFPGSKDIIKTMKSAGAMAQHDLHATLGLIYRELPKMRIAKLVKEANKLVPSASIAGDWKRKPGGIRSQLVNLRTGELEQDFIVEATEHETHILNAVSPGWTSAIPFAEWIYQEYVLPSISTRNQ